jgi:branched-chain amino acid transport system ATP-binding protein
MTATSKRTPARGPENSGEPLLEAVNLCVGYGNNPVVRDVDLTVHAGEVVALLGPNGAGKTTTLLGLAGELRPTKGAVRMYGEVVTSPLHRRARAGLAYISEERSIIRGLSVADNLRLSRGNLELAYELFPELTRLRRRQAGILSGGEQQILTYARALSRSPKILIADELSLGLAPTVVRRLMQAIKTAARDGLAVLLVEQQVRTALAVADRGYLLRQGEIVLHGPSDSLLNRIDEIEIGYLSA